MNFLGIEIGGTKLQLAIGAGDGTCSSVVRLSADALGGAAAIRIQMEEAARSLMNNSGPAAAVGIGFGGPVDDSYRTTITSHQVKGWENFPLAEWAEQIFGVPAALGNDADIAGLAEATLGAGKGYSPVLYMNVGSGIGGTLIENGRIYRGCGRGASEIGHLWIQHDGNHNTGQWIRLEHIASGWAMADRYRKLSKLDRDKVTGQDVAAAVQQGDALAVQTLEEATDAIALGLSHALTLFGPQRIVLGGGVSLMEESLFLQPIREKLTEIGFPPFRGTWSIVPAALGEDVVLHGAIQIASVLKT